jgi:hypothetical protein
MSITTHSTVENICFQIAQLDAIGQREVFERIEELRTKPADKDGGAFRISDLWGVGAEIWQDESVNEYIQKERDSWD